MKNFDFKRYLIALNDCNKLKLKSLAIKVTMLSLCILGFSTLLSEPVIVQLLTLSICFLTIDNSRFTEKSKLSTEVSQPPFTAKERLLAQATHLFYKKPTRIFQSHGIDFALAFAFSCPSTEHQLGRHHWSKDWHEVVDGTLVYRFSHHQTSHCTQ